MTAGPPSAAAASRAFARHKTPSARFRHSLRSPATTPASARILPPRRVSAPPGDHHLRRSVAGVAPLLIVDAANVVGSVPDGWWRDRAGAAERLRDALAAAGPAAIPGAADDAEIVLVVEGAARRVPAVPGIRVVAADRSGDDAIVELCREN